MIYMGSKGRIAKNLVPIIQSYIDDYKINTYVEPFVGGANIFDKIKCNRKIAGDNQEYLIELFKNLHRLNELPKFIDREHYSDVRDSYNKKDGRYEKWYIGAIGFFASFNGRFFDGGYGGIIKTKDGKTTDRYNDAKRRLEEQIPNLDCDDWRYGDYRQTVNDITCALIYCDPPYKGTKQYKASKNFNHEEFWNWCREKSKENIVLISEQEAPEDFVCIWEQEVKRIINKGNSIKATEKLFIHNSLIK